MRTILTALIAATVLLGAAAVQTPSVAADTEFKVVNLFEEIEKLRDKPLDRHERMIVIDGAKRLKLALQSYRRAFAGKVSELLTVSPSLLLENMDQLTAKPDMPVRKTNLFAVIEKSLGRSLTDDERAKIIEFDSVRRADEAGKRAGWALEMAPVFGVPIKDMNRIAAMVH
jgi:hypothetical protein